MFVGDFEAADRARAAREKREASAETALANRLADVVEQLLERRVVARI